jgi:hypothetical protein
MNIVGKDSESRHLLRKRWKTGCQREWFKLWRQILSKMNITVSFSVPGTFVFPSFYRQATPEQTAHALQLGAKVYEYMFESIAEETRRECNTEVVDELEKKFSREKKVLEDRLDTLKAKLKDDEQFQQGLREQVKQQMEDIYKHLLHEKDRQIRRLEDQVSMEVRGLQDKFQSMKDSVSRQLGSQEKGKVGEVAMEDLIKKSFGSADGFDLLTTGKEAQRGDHIMTYKSIKVMWEIKNYTRMVNKDEVEKLHRDMRSNPDVRVAFMVSLYAGIVGHVKAGDIDMEILEDGRMIFYLTNFYKREDPLLYLQSLRPFLDYLQSKPVQTRQLESEEISKLESKMKILQYFLLNHQKTLHSLYNSLVQQKKKSDQMNTELVALIRQAEMECTNSLKELLQDTEHTDQDTQVSLNPELFTKTVFVDLTATQKRFLDWFKENCEEDSHGEIEAKKFQEAYKGIIKTEKEQKEVRELFQESVWPKGGKKVKGIRFS